MYIAFQFIYSNSFAECSRRIAPTGVDEFFFLFLCHISLVVTEDRNYNISYAKFSNWQFHVRMWFEAVALSPCWISIGATQRSRPIDCPWIRCFGAFELTPKSTACWKCALCGLCHKVAYVWQQFIVCTRERPRDSWNRRRRRRISFSRRT